MNKKVCQCALTDEQVLDIAEDDGAHIASMYAMKKVGATTSKGFKAECIEYFLGSKQKIPSVDMGLEQFYDDMMKQNCFSANSMKLTPRQYKMYRDTLYATFMMTMNKMRVYGVFNHFHAQVVDLVETYGFPIMSAVKK